MIKFMIFLAQFHLWLLFLQRREKELKCLLRLLEPKSRDENFERGKFFSSIFLVSARQIREGISCPNYIKTLAVISCREFLRVEFRLPIRQNKQVTLEDLLLLIALANFVQFFNFCLIFVSLVSGT